MSVVKTRALTKRFGNKAAVDTFDMQVNKGDIYGFVGHNGAGKSTVMRMLSGLTTPTEGTVEVFGSPVDTSGAKKLGVLIDGPGLYPTMSAYDNLMLKCLCVGVVSPKQTTVELLDFVGLADVGKKASRFFSTGMKQRLGLALALVGNPDLLLLDEPLNGLDPEGSREIRQLIIRLNEERGLTVIISSHILDQLGRMCNRYGVIRAGRMVAELTTEQVAQECSAYLHLETSDPAKALAVLQERFTSLDFTAMPDGALRISGAADAGLIGAALAEAGIAVTSLYTHRRDLEDFFVEMMGGN
ncbi:MAG TPA: ABC transporter [Coriobacteriia bacterium]|nr:ABC transporter [Coriobacteriia bacterium]